MHSVLAVDLGASGGRLMLGMFDGENISLKEIHRFANGAVKIRGRLYWNILELMQEIYIGLQKAAAYQPKSLAVDTWGVDFGLLDPDGNLLENPVQYRDKRTQGMLEEAFKRLEKDSFYERTGIQFMEINTAFQLLSLRLHRPTFLKKAEKLLFMPDLINYFLTGKQYAEYSIASTSQLLDVHTKEWSDTVLAALDLPKEILPEIIAPGTVIGTLDAEIQKDLEIPPMDVVAVCGHDTQSAMMAVPAQEKDFLFISCGTWSLIGTELDTPIVNKEAQIRNMTNEGGYGKKISFLTNMTGLWVLQQCRNWWNSQGQDLDYSELTQLAMQAESRNIFIDTDDILFSQPGNMPKQIDAYCTRTGQEKPASIGEYALCILESLALKYKQAVENIKACTGVQYPRLHLLGGGTKNALLCQCTANACGLPVVAGPVEATALGNVAIQLIATGAIADLQAAREILRKQKDVLDYNPKDLKIWDEKYQKFLEILKK